MKTIGITLGDQAGIGPEIVDAALERLALPDGVEVRVIGERLEGVVPGKPTLETARAALDSLEESTRLMRDGEIAAVVTAPVAKEGLHQLGFDFPGQTEFFAERLDCENFAMCLTGRSLTVALVTIHVPIARVPGLLSEEEIVRVGALLAGFLEQKNRRKARVAVCGLNPHAGENGAFGDEEVTIIAPAIQLLGERYPEAEFSGPHPPDTVFGAAAQGEYDGVLCMYHDQGLIPLKLLDFDNGVNVTLGLPVPRTSPDHGTAFGIAGKGIAKADSMLSAIQTACDLVRQ
ncbi:4-hydroxythreonine-4-phosphate dehydrogenase PdxA [Rubritalea marina]|uniref:4-hydroxythreonine-4-phosphate dehydrogenase PdxA n=1 Tax=Rubritalea marina TaxID=361055 RepID=UPI000381D407|nr:4-hydroxythreonine-4-phosphate dehydrogenase PdxA [Rubritalea marina]